MARRTITRKTAEQLKTMVWESQDEAERDIKASGVPLGDDSELREYRPGSWQIMPIAAPETPAAEDREGTVLTNLRKKPGAPPRGEAKVIAQAKAPAPKKGKAKAAAIDGNGKKDHRDPPSVLTASAAKPPAKAPRKAKPVKPDPRPGVVGIAPKALEKVAKATPAPEPVAEPAKPSADLFLPLPKEGQPYALVIIEGTGEAFPQHAAHTAALDVARRLRSVVLVRDKDGLTVRRYDPAEFARKAPRAASGAGTRAKADGPGENSKFGKASKLLFREQGATAKELEAATGWVGVTQRHINRASKLNNDARIEHIGPKHWRLVKRGD